MRWPPRWAIIVPEDRERAKRPKGATLMMVIYTYLPPPGGLAAVARSPRPPSGRLAAVARSPYGALPTGFWGSLVPHKGQKAAPQALLYWPILLIMWLRNKQWPHPCVTKNRQVHTNPTAGKNTITPPFWIRPSSLNWEEQKTIHIQLYHIPLCPIHIPRMPYDVMI